jgi:hypothetical protein
MPFTMKIKAMRNSAAMKKKPVIPVCVIITKKMMAKGKHIRAITIAR